MATTLPDGVLVIDGCPPSKGALVEYVMWFVCRNASDVLNSGSGDEDQWVAWLKQHRVILASMPEKDLASEILMCPLPDVWGHA